jgi:uncharacterized protein YdhG (YjbR/CyaY superfamily)
MVMKRYDSVAAYIAGQPKPAQASLRQMRATIRKAVPAAVEGMSYGIPGYKLNGRVLLYFAAWKQHYAVYPATAGVQAACQRELARYEVGKGTIRFPIDEAVPARLVAKVAKVRAAEVEAVSARKTARTRLPRRAARPR